MARFTALRTSDGFVVIDVVDAACTPCDLGESEAESLAAELNAMVAAGHQIDAVRWVQPQQVRAASWRPAGVIDVWLFDKQSDQWVARLRDDSGHVEWCPGSDLRPDPVDEQLRRGADAMASDRRAS